MEMHANLRKESKGVGITQEGLTHSVIGSTLQLRLTWCNRAFTCSSNGPVSRAVKSFIQVQCVYELLSNYVQTTRMLQT